MISLVIERESKSYVWFRVESEGVIEGYRHSGVTLDGVLCGSLWDSKGRILHIGTKESARVLRKTFKLIETCVASYNASRKRPDSMIGGNPLLLGVFGDSEEIYIAKKGNIKGIVHDGVKIDEGEGLSWDGEKLVVPVGIFSSPLVDERVRVGKDDLKRIKSAVNALCREHAKVHRGTGDDSGIPLFPEKPLRDVDVCVNDLIDKLNDEIGTKMEEMIECVREIERLRLKVELLGRLEIDGGESIL